MFILKIDATERKIKKVTLLEQPTSSTKSVLKDEIVGDIDIPSAVDALLKKNNLQYSDVDQYINEEGHGSFTGIKTGACVTNIISWWAKKQKAETLKSPDYGSEPNIQKNS